MTREEDIEASVWEIVGGAYDLFSQGSGSVAETVKKVLSSLRDQEARKKAEDKEPTLSEKGSRKDQTYLVELGGQKFTRAQWEAVQVYVKGLSEDPGAAEGAKASRQGQVSKFSVGDLVVFPGPTRIVALAPSGHYALISTVDGQESVTVPIKMLRKV